MKNKGKILFIIGLTLMVITSIVSVSAVTYITTASDIGYDNTVSELQSTDVQSAIDELYVAATNYAKFNNYFRNDPTSYFDGNTLHVGKNSSNLGSSIDLYYGDSLRGTISTTENSLKINSNGTNMLQLVGGVFINGDSFGNTSTTTSAQHSSGLTLKFFQTGKIGQIYITGTTASELNITNNYICIGSVPNNFRPSTDITDYQPFSGIYNGNVLIKSTGEVCIGKTNTTIASSKQLYISSTYLKF